MNHFSRLTALIAAATLAGCAIAPPVVLPLYSGPSTQAFSPLEIKIEGLKTNVTAYDGFRLQVLDPALPKLLGIIDLAPGQATARMDIDQEKPLLIGISRNQTRIGGYVACVADIPVTAKAGEKYAITYTSQGAGCTIVLSKAIGSGDFVQVSVTPGSVSGIMWRPSPY